MSVYDFELDDLILNDPTSKVWIMTRNTHGTVQQSFHLNKEDTTWITRIIRPQELQITVYGDQIINQRYVMTIEPDERKNIKVEAFRETNYSPHDPLPRKDGLAKRMRNWAIALSN
jgi:hypothetical protein